MTTVRPEVYWFPTDERYFLMWSSNLQQYQVQCVQPEETITPPRTRLGSKTAANLVASNSEYQYIKTVALHYGFKEDPSHQIIAAGLANGKVVLTTFNRSSDIHGLIGKEYVPKYPRPANTLAWHPQFKQFLALGLDKIGRDNSVMVLDVIRGSPSASTPFDQRNLNRAENLRPVIEWGLGENAISLDFCRDDPHTILTGLSHRHIKLFDIRENKAVITVTTKAVFGICSDPILQQRFASYVDSTVYLWDMRNLERPLHTLVDPSNKPIIKMAWAPVRQGFLTTLSRESSCLRIFDMQSQNVGRDDLDRAVFTRSVPLELNFISSFAWHPTTLNRILIASYSGKLVDHTVYERVTLNWSNLNTLVWSQGKTLYSITEDNSPLKTMNEMPLLIKTRAFKGYGTHPNKLSLNGEVTGDPNLQCLWTWLEEAAKLNARKVLKEIQVPGILSILKEGLKSSIVYKHWEGHEHNKAATVKVFKSEERNYALSLCSWDFDSKDNTIDDFLRHLESRQQHSRAAAVSVFNLDIPRAVQILQRASFKDPSCNGLAMALAGFTTERKALWRETCSHLLKKISDPYIRAIFIFLTGEGETYDPILLDNNLVLNDKIAFACYYLSDFRLLEYLNKLKEVLTGDINLTALMLIGLSEEGQEHLQNYLEVTGDIQTPALIAAHVLNPIMELIERKEKEEAKEREKESKEIVKEKDKMEVAKIKEKEKEKAPEDKTERSEIDNRLSHWIYSYRQLLDSLQLWNERASFDVLTNRGSKGIKPSSKSAQQIYITCNYCMKSISPYIQMPGKARNPSSRFGTGATNKRKMSSCPNCFKPLPRCAICLQHMGTSSMRTEYSTASDTKKDNNTRAVKPHLSKTLTQFSSWFTWCQSCRHGGHAEHMISWFKEYSECAVTSCACKCMLLDSLHKNHSGAQVATTPKPTS